MQVSRRCVAVTNDGRAEAATVSDRTQRWTKASFSRRTQPPTECVTSDGTQHAPDHATRFAARWNCCDAVHADSATMASTTPTHLLSMFMSPGKRMCGDCFRPEADIRQDESDRVE